MSILDAQAYVGTDWNCGAAQLQLLKREGLLPSHNVLEIGCGCLSAGVHLMRYLETGRYVGIEPNRWLVESALEDPSIAALFKECEATVLYVTDFDASGCRGNFDFVLSHSVLSHCGTGQVEPFIASASRVIVPTGKILASFRMAEGNDYGSTGSPDRKDSTFPDWQYPGIAWYRQETICTIAHRCNLIAMLRPDLTRMLTRSVPKDFHDWMLFIRPPP